jgi:hypothetical protein
LTPDALAHESAHNLALNTFGSAKPELSSSFVKDRKFKMQGRRQRITNAVTDYGQWSPEEDFAEYVTAYNSIVVNGESNYRQATLSKLHSRPRAFNAVSKMLGDKAKAPAKKRK